MKKGIGAEKRRIRWFLILGIFAVFLSAEYLIGALEIILTKTGVISKDNIVESRGGQIMLWGGASCLLGFVLSLFMTRLVLSPFNELLDGLTKLSSGEYSTRIKTGNGQAWQTVADRFNGLANELEKTEILRADFVNAFSHEFKTPINSINGLITLMKKGGLSEEKQREYLTIIEEETHRLASMTTNILTLTKLENQGIVTNKTKFNLSEQMRSCVLLLERKWTAKKLNLSLDFDEQDVYGNEDMLSQVWVNLLDNAIKFSETGGELGVRIWAEREKVYTEISNQGVQIPEEDKERIFQKFYRLDDAHAKEGNGIGLSIVKRIVDLHDGEIFVQSKQGKTTFTVVLFTE